MTMSNDKMNLPKAKEEASLQSAERDFDSQASVRAGGAEKEQIQAHEKHDSNETVRVDEKQVGADHVPEGEEKMSPTSKRPREETVLDLATRLGLKPGDRVEVEWDVSNGQDEDQASTVRTRWWGATLMEYDGEVKESVRVHRLDYDPYPEGGFPERSIERVVFTGPDELADPESRDSFRFRREGGEETLRVSRDDIENIVNDTLMRAMKNNEQSWNSLDRAKQGHLASLIERKKRKLTELLVERSGKEVVTAGDMKSILEETMKT